MEPSAVTHICIPAAMMTERASTHNSTAVKRGYRMLVIILMPRDRNFIRDLSSTHQRVVSRNG